MNTLGAPNSAQSISSITWKCKFLTDAQLALLTNSNSHVMPSGSGQGSLVGCCECSNEPSGSIKSGEFLDR